MKRFFRRVLSKWTLLLAWLLLAFAALIVLNTKYLNLDRTYPGQDLAKIPDADEISNAIENLTAIVGNNERTYAVYFFSKDGKFWQWRNNSIETGHWYADYQWFFLKEYSKFYFSKLPFFCIFIETESESLNNEDACETIFTLQRIFSGFFEVRKGDVFGLSKRVEIGTLPSTPMSVDKLKNLVK